MRAATATTIILGASTWRIQDITRDRVVVIYSAPEEPGKCRSGTGDAPGRPSEFGERIGALVRELVRLPGPVAFTKLVHEHKLEFANAAENLLRYLEEQAAATEHVPSDEDIVIEVCRDELGDRRACAY